MKNVSISESFIKVNKNGGYILATIIRRMSYIIRILLWLNAQNTN